MGVVGYSGAAATSTRSAAVRRSRRPFLLVVERAIDKRGVRSLAYA